MDATTYTRCSSCGKRILFAADAEGHRIPLDLVAPTYTVLAGVALDAALCERANGAGVNPPTYVSHFATCPQATAHSRTKAVG